MSTSNPTRDAEEHFDEAEAAGEARQESRRRRRQALEEQFYTALCEDNPFPDEDPNTLFDILCDELDSVKSALGYLARIRETDPVIRGILNTLAASYVKSVDYDATQTW